MNDSSTLQSRLQIKLRSRSMGMKLIVVCGLALFMTIPAFFVRGLVDDRTNRAANVIKEISSHVGGQQTFLGPTLAIPYNIPPQSQSDAAKHGVYPRARDSAPAALADRTVASSVVSGDCRTGYCLSLHRESLRSPHPDVNLETPPLFHDDFVVSKQSSPVARKHAMPADARMRVLLQLMS